MRVTELGLFCFVVFSVEKFSEKNILFLIYLYQANITLGYLLPQLILEKIKIIYICTASTGKGISK